MSRTPLENASSRHPGSRIRVVVAASLVMAAASCSSGSGEAATSTTTDVVADDTPAEIEEVITSISTFPTELDPRIWVDGTMKPDVRDRTLEIVDGLFADAAIPGAQIDAVELFGSNASFEYDDDADFGVHVFVSSTEMDDAQLEPIIDILNDYVEQTQEGKITFYGVPLEVVFHAGRDAGHQPADGIGQYSITEDRWIVEPVPQPDNFDREQMVTDATGFVEQYNEVVEDYEAEPESFDCTRFAELKGEMKDYRSAAFEDGLGSRSTANLTYRALRRLSVNIPDELDRLEAECTYEAQSLS